MTAPRPDALVEQAIVLRDAKRPELALRKLQEALAVDPEHGRALIWLSIVLRVLKRSKDALKAAQAAARAQPTSSDAHIQLSESLKALCRNEEALAAAKRAVKLGPQYPRAFLILTRRLLSLRHTREACEAARQATTIDAADECTLEARLAIAWEREDWDEAEDVARLRLALRPESPHAIRGLASALLKRGRTREAMQLLEAAVRADPADTWAPNKLKSMARRYITTPALYGLIMMLVGVWFAYNTPPRYWAIAGFFVMVGLSYAGKAASHRLRLSRGGRRFLRSPAVQRWVLIGWTVLLLASFRGILLVPLDWVTHENSEPGLKQFSIMIAAPLAVLISLRRIRPIRQVRNWVGRMVRDNTGRWRAMTGWIVLLLSSLVYFGRVWHWGRDNVLWLDHYVLMLGAVMSALVSMSRLTVEAERGPK